MNIGQVKDCFGCGVCAIVCTRHAIDIRLNKYGFYEPKIIDKKLCTDCGLCVSVCAYSNQDIKKKSVLKSFAARSLSKYTEQTSTSGGVSYEIGIAAISNGYKFCGAIYDVEKNIVCHIIATTVEGVKLTQGSKYLQSYTVDAFRSLNKKEKNVVVGTPCQMASLRRYIQKFKCEDNFLLIDFFCHGVPSKLMWDKYIRENSSDLGTIKNASWRNKLRGWHAGYCITLEGTNKTYRSYNWDGDDFFTLFLGDACLGKACYDKCRFKYDNSAADIRIGDLWGKESRYETRAICAVACFSQKGVEAIENLELDIKELTFEQCAEGQMKTNSQRPWYCNVVSANIGDSHIPLWYVALPIRLYRKAIKVINNIKNLAKG
ncbi:MAG: Coenzyme F420 hydrogenase/dehydrogenase, beta subunit C-terminal domain [Muribaculaceae bacterium]|nr:Coenzyme F420 hydrogenase/dehydrogenase, beta subunit C-terminal domain [Muribaculaceae bacterium]